ncbi:cell wall-binding repeat-containing protein [Leifsonia poae]|uniref:cell wall-binding repeat-containing protein n=1 Tax=Leifsonia poae TaxID=110933 RepID=UPI003D6778F4
MSFEGQYTDATDGIYSFCGTISPTDLSFGAGSTGIGCVSGAFNQMAVTTAPSLVGDGSLGTTLQLTQGTFTPVPSAEDVTWKRVDLVFSAGVPYSDMSSTLIPGPGGRQYTPAAGDVGHRIVASDTVFADGFLGQSFSRETQRVTIPGVSTSRIGGSDRYAASVGISTEEFPDANAGARVVYVASGANFPDALSAGPAAAKEGGPLLLTTPGQLPAAVSSEITRLHPDKVVVVGGPASVSPAVFDALNGLAPTIRIGGADRYAVSRALIDYAFPDGAPSLYLVTGEKYPDALSASGAAASAGEPVLLTPGSRPTADQGTVSELRSLHVTHVTIAGGPGSVSQGLATTLGAGIDVTRASGSDRYAAAVSVSRSAFATAPKVFLVTGLNYPDGLSAGAAAGREHSPLYLTDGTCVPQDVIKDIVSLHATSVVIVGGTGSVQTQVGDLYACSY